MDFIFYIIYNSYFKHGNYKNDIPPLTVGGIFTVVFFCLTLLIKGIRAYVLYGNVPFAGFEKNHAPIVGFFCAIAAYLMFYRNKRYINIYNQFKDNQFANSWPGKILGWMAIILLMLSPFIFTSIRKNFL